MCCRIPSWMIRMARPWIECCDTVMLWSCDAVIWCRSFLPSFLDRIHHTHTGWQDHSSGFVGSEEGGLGIGLVHPSPPMCLSSHLHTRSDYDTTTTWTTSTPRTRLLQSASLTAQGDRKCYFARRTTTTGLLAVFARMKNRWRIACCVHCNSGKFLEANLFFFFLLSSFFSSSYIIHRSIDHIIASPHHITSHIMIPR